jgi:hypothetical protein
MSMSYSINVLYTFNATHMSRMTVLYVFNALPILCVRPGHDESDVRRLGNAQVRFRGRWAQLSK